MEGTLLSWVRSSWLPEIASTVGLSLTLLGLAITFRASAGAREAAKNAKAAADAASEAAIAAKEEVAKIESFIDLSSVITAMETIKALHRERAWGRLLERYAEARRVLTQVRVRTVDLTAIQIEIIQNCIDNFAALESNLDRNIDTPDKINIEKANSKISANIDALVELLNILRTRGAS